MIQKNIGPSHRNSSIFLRSKGALWDGATTDAVKTLKEQPMFLWHCADDKFVIRE